MAKKDTKRVSISAWEKVMKEHFDNTPVHVDWNGIEVEVKKLLPLKEMIVFVEEIVEACFGKDGVFLPQAEPFAIRSGVLSHYAGFAMPESLEKQYELVMGTDAADVVLMNINRAQLDDLIEAADRKIDFICDSNAMTAKAEADKVLAAFQELGESMKAVFGDMSAEDIQKVLSAVGNLGEVDEGKIVEAYAKQKREAEEVEAAARPDVPEGLTKETDGTKSEGEAE